MMPSIQVHNQVAVMSGLEPFAEEPKQVDKSLFIDEKGGNYQSICVGSWECEPGMIRLDGDSDDFGFLVMGRWIFTSDEGEVTKVQAGDAYHVPRGWKGTVEIVEKIRKVYFIVE